MEVFGFEKRIKHYTNYQRILLVGEGDFSFAVSLARAFGSSTKMIATSLDTRGELIKYSKAMSNLRELESRGCQILHGVDVNTMLHHPELINKQFDRIIYNFPHAGYLKGRCRSREKNKFQILLHQSLVRGYFMNSREMLTKNGEIHVTHKTSYPFSEWEIVELAEEAELFLVKEEEFYKLDYPGYENKRGDRICDESFPVGKSSTFIFAKRLYPNTRFHPGTLSISTRFHPGTLSISTWPADIIDMACTYLDSLEMKKSNRGHKA
ncbi:uncharacterized protein ABKV19_005649 [Rosa sericea]